MCTRLLNVINQSCAKLLNLGSILAELILIDTGEITEKNMSGLQFIFMLMYIMARMIFALTVSVILKLFALLVGDESIISLTRILYQQLFWLWWPFYDDTHQFLSIFNRFLGASPQLKNLDISRHHTLDKVKTNQWMQMNSITLNKNWTVLNG